MREHLLQLTAHGPRHPSNPAGVSEALGYLRGCLSSYGYDVEVERYGRGSHEVNLLAALPGEWPTLEIGAHWDTVAGSPGADDDASGVAGVLELARHFAADPPLRTIRFCLFGGEEDGMRGSQAHVSGLGSAVPGRDRAVDGIIVLEMIGYRDTRPGAQKLPPGAVEAGIDPARFERGDFIAAVGDKRAGDTLIAIWSAGKEHGLPVLPVSLPPGHHAHGARSDHHPYWLSGRMGIMITDTAEFRNPHYHQPSDTLETLDLDFAAQATRTVATAVRALTV